MVAPAARASGAEATFAPSIHRSAVVPSKVPAIACQRSSQIASGATASAGVRACSCSPPGAFSKTFHHRLPEALVASP